MTVRKIEIHPEALTEAEAAVSWYAERSSRAPAAFIAEVDSAIESILEAPERWPLYEGDCRRFPLFRFPYVVVYRQKSTAVVEIVAIAHGRRRPGYWRGRTK